MDIKAFAQMCCTNNVPLDVEIPLEPSKARTQIEVGQTRGKCSVSYIRGLAVG